MQITTLLNAKRLLVALLGVLLAVLLAMSLQAKPAVAAPTCTDSLQAKINAAPSGGTVTANPCIYREQVTITKPIILKGQPGSEIRGSDVWSGWTKSGTSSWFSSKTLPPMPVPKANTPTGSFCNGDTKRCNWREQVFFDGKPLLQVASNPKPGQFAVNSSRRVILADNPVGHTVEVTTRPQWVVGKASGVTIQGFTMKHAANDHQSNGALTNNDYSNWTIQDNVLSDAHTTVVTMRKGTNLRLLRNDISRGGQMGVSGGIGNHVVQNNKIHHNSTEDFHTWYIGGIKLGAVKSLTASGNEIYSNSSPGLWCDVGCTNVVISNNRIHHNERMGINFEISDGAKISGNTVWENGWSKTAWGWGAGIVSSSSKNVEIYSNTLAWNADGISVISQDRGGTDHDAVTGVSVHDNTILAKDYPEPHTYALGWLQPWSGVMYVPSSNNRGANNRYWYPTAEGSYVRFGYQGNVLKKLLDFNKTLGDEGGRYLTLTEKNSVVSTKGIPASPESH